MLPSASFDSSSYSAKAAGSSGLIPMHDDEPSACENKGGGRGGRAGNLRPRPSCVASWHSRPLRLGLRSPSALAEEVGSMWKTVMAPARIGANSVAG